jgi:hypothetical protein
VTRSNIAAAVIFLACLGDWAGPAASAQSMDDLNLQIHGYVTQGVLYSTHNNWNTTSSSDGSAAWSEAVLNVAAQPVPRLRIGVQARYSLLGVYGNTIALDWAQADYKLNERFGFRAGKVKTPVGLLNESQDIDPAHLWVLLPQSVYPLASRDSRLSHYGGVGYGRLPLGEALGTLEYRGFGGQRIIDANDDGILQPFKDNGLSFPAGLSGPVGGATLCWEMPVQGLMAGSTIDIEGGTAPSAFFNSIPGTFTGKKLKQPFYFARYERNKLMVAGEYIRIVINSTIQLTGIPPIPLRDDIRAFYAMSSYKISEKLTGGMYFSSSINLQVPVTSARYQKDWAIAGRYDFNPFLYIKIEQHFIDGTAIGFSSSDNPGGLQPNTRMTLLKIGVII